MANHKSAKIRIKRNEKKAVKNASYLSRVRTFVKKVEKAILGGNKEEAKENLVLAESALSKAAHKGIVKKSAASRTTSRLSARVKKI